MTDNGREAEQACLEAVRRLTDAERGPMELHGRRVALIAGELARRSGREIDRELLACAGLLHDMALYPGASRGGVYTADGAAFARELLGGKGFEGARLELLERAIDRHHDLRPQWTAGLEVELVRRADLVDVSAGLIRFGLPRAWLRTLGHELPRDGMYREIARMVRRQRARRVVRIFLR